MARNRWRRCALATAAAVGVAVGLVPVVGADPAGAALTELQFTAVRDCADGAVITGTGVVTVSEPDDEETVEAAVLYVRGPANDVWLPATKTMDDATEAVDFGFTAELADDVPHFAPVDLALFTDGADTTAEAPLVAVEDQALQAEECTQRISGPDAIDTSIAISKASFPAADSAGAVVLARSDWFSDALAGGPLAADWHAPLLITPGAPIRASLDPRVLVEINRVLAPEGKVLVLGGPLAIAAGVIDQLNNLDYDVERVFGANQFSTAVAIAEALGNPGVVFQATGLHFADALSAVPAAIDSGGAILLTNGPTQSDETAAYLAAHQGVVRYAIGGVLAASGADPTAESVWGDDLYGTSAAVAARFFDDPASIGLATGRDFPDALGGGVFMASSGRRGPMVLVDRNQPLPPPVADHVDALEGLQVVFVFGGTVAIEDGVVGAVWFLATD